MKIHDQELSDGRHFVGKSKDLKLEDEELLFESQLKEFR
jgi:hypothetical protein